MPNVGGSYENIPFTPAVHPSPVRMSTPFDASAWNIFFFGRARACPTVDSVFAVVRRDNPFSATHDEHADVARMLVLKM